MYGVMAQKGGTRGKNLSKKTDKAAEVKEEHSRSKRNEAITTRIIDFIKRRFNPAKESDLDEMTMHTGVRHRPEELAKLASMTKFSKKEIKLIYRGFKQECPTGMVDEDSFKHIFSQFFPQGDATNYAHYVFNTIKHKQQGGKINFEEFLSILSRVSRGTTQDKLQWVFALYDLDGDGVITKAEMTDVVTSIYEMLGRATLPIVQETSAKDHVDRIFHLIDSDQDGCVSMEELTRWCRRDDRLLQSFDTLDTVL